MGNRRERNGKWRVAAWIIASDRGRMPGHDEGQRALLAIINLAQRLVIAEDTLHVDKGPIRMGRAEISRRQSLGVDDDFFECCN